MDFHTFLNNIKIIDSNGETNLTIYPWMTDIRNHTHVISATPRRIGTTTYVMMSALYDVIFSNIKLVRIVVYQGGYRKKDLINMLLTNYTWLMKDMCLDKEVLSFSDSHIKIGDSIIEVFGMHELDPSSAMMMGRGRTIEKTYADVFCVETDNIMEILLNQFQMSKQCVLFFQGIRCNSKIKKLFDQYYEMDDMEKVHKILKEEFYWHAIKINHNLTDIEEEQAKSAIGNDRFSIEYEI